MQSRETAMAMATRTTKAGPAGAPWRAGNCPIHWAWYVLASALVGIWIAGFTGFTCSAAENDPLSVTVRRADLRPLSGVTVRLRGAAIVEAITEETGRATFPDPVPAGEVTITPSRSGFRFEPPNLTAQNPGEIAARVFTAFPVSTDLALSITNDTTFPLVGGVVNGVITLRNIGAEAATDVVVGFGSLPGLVLENAQPTQGTLQTRAPSTLWKLPQLDTGASAEVRVRSRATLPDASVLAVAAVEAMDQADTDPLNNSAQATILPRPAQCRLTLAMTIQPATAKVGDTLPVQLTIRNEGPNDATQVVVQNYLPPGVSFVQTTNLSGLLNKVVIPRLEPGNEEHLSAGMLVRFVGTYTLIANVTYLEQQLPAGAPWPEVRADFTVEHASSRLTLLAFTDPPNPRVGDTVTVDYVARNDGPDPVTGLDLYAKADPRLGLGGFIDPARPHPPVPGPFVFGDELPVGAYRYLRFSYSVKAAGDLTNYFTVKYQDQDIANGEDYPELSIPIKALPADVGLSLDANPKDITVHPGDPVTIEFPVHNDGPHPARGIIVDYTCPGLTSAESDEVIHDDRVLRPGTFGFIDVIEPGETVLLRKHFFASRSGVHTNSAEITTPAERPDLIRPVAMETIRVEVLPSPPPNLAIFVKVDKPQVDVGEYAIFIVSVTNLANEPAVSVTVRETDASDVDFAFETVRSYGPWGDDQVTSASQRTIPFLEPGAGYSMSRTMRIRKAVAIPYVAKIESVNGLPESALPDWRAQTEVSGVQVVSDMATEVVPDRRNVKAGDLVNFAIISRNVSSRTASHVGINVAESAGFQVLDTGLGSYGYFFDYSRPTESSSPRLFSEWTESGSKEAIVSWISTYAVAEGQLKVGAELAYLDQQDAQPANDLNQVQIDSAAAHASVSLQQSMFSVNPAVGDLVFFRTEIRNEGPDRITGLCLAETVSSNLEPSLNSAVTGMSGDFVTSFLDDLLRLPALDPGENFILQRTYVARAAGESWHKVKVARYDQTPLVAVPESEAGFVVQPAQADLELELRSAPATAEVDIPVPVVVRVRNLGPAVATGVKVAVNLPWDALRLGIFELGPRASYDWVLSNGFQTNLRPGESATVLFYMTPLREGTALASVDVHQTDQTDPEPENSSVSLTVEVGPAPPIPQILRLRKVRTDFFDRTPIAEVEIDQAALNRLAPLGLFRLEGSSNLRDWEFLTYAGFLPFVPITFTDHVPSGPATPARTFRLRSF